MSTSSGLTMGFPRQEVLKLTGCTSSRLTYLEKVGLVVPQRIGPGKRPVVLFSWEQLVEIIAIKDLRKQVSLQTVRNIVSFLDKEGYGDSLSDKLLVVIGSDVLWVNSDWSDFKEQAPQALKVAGRGNIGQFEMLVIPPFCNLVNEIWDNAENSNVIDFESFKLRAKAKRTAA